MTTFSDLGLTAELCSAVATEGYVTPTPIQAAAIPALLEGRDLLGIAQTGTGKTAAFALPVLQRLMAAPKRPAAKSVRALVLTPTRELAVQICDGFRTYGRNLPIRSTVIFGGVGQVPQVAALSKGVDVLVATPGRLLDLIEQKHLRLDLVEVFVLDEADRMLDMGFVRDVRKVLGMLPKQRQTLLFSATMPGEIASLASDMLGRDPARVEVTPPATTVERIEQRVLFVRKDDKRRLLVDLLNDRGVGRAIIFTRTKHGANRVAEQLQKSGVPADAIHGNKSQNARQRALNDFKEGRLRTLVATDIAARGIDIDGVTHVINFDMPVEPESYVHRIGRTARAGADGIALSLCDGDELAQLKAIEKSIRQPVPVHETHAYHVPELASQYARGHAPRAAAAAKPARSGRPPQRGRSPR